jgi:HEPN domain-containing protein
VWNLVVRRCQEAVELALKGLLRSAGVEVPKIHDVSGSLLRNADRLPEAASREIQALVSASRRLREEREISFYGDEESDTEADRLYSKDDAEEAVTLARRVVAICNAARAGR